MQKTGRVELGKTPSVVSGKPAQMLVQDEPVCDGEQPVDPGFEKLAKSLNPDQVS